MSVAESTRVVDLVQDAIDAFLDERQRDLAEIAPDLFPFVDYSRDLLRGGKRFRALFCFWGWQAVDGVVDQLDPMREPAGVPDAVVQVAAGLELFHAAALVHDDVMDNSDTRRGLPAAHRRFEHLHRDSAWRGVGRKFGESGALLLGDLLLGWSDELVDAGLSQLRDRDAARAARAEFTRMRTEVTVGQYLDVLEEAAWASHPEAEQLGRAHRVVVYKSAKYSVEAPLLIGAALAGGTEAQLDALAAYGLPLGIAYQLRDDLLGVFGDPEQTGKPAGDDLREGKRTVLIGIARRALPAGTVRLFDELLGDPQLDGEQISMLRSALTESGAVAQVERIIDRNVDEATAALVEAPLSRTARDQLTTLAGTVARRSA
jgi:geranylgeranyl diphosphate synthase, type I